MLGVRPRLCALVSQLHPHSRDMGLYSVQCDLNPPGSHP